MGFSCVSLTYFDSLIIKCGKFTVRCVCLWQFERSCSLEQLPPSVFSMREGRSTPKYNLISSQNYINCTRMYRSQDRSVVWLWATSWMIEFRVTVRARNFFFTTASRLTLGPTQSPIQWVPGALSLGVKRPGREAGHSPPSSAEAMNVWSYISTPPISLHDVVLG
jgi:hypothetical protein